MDRDQRKLVREIVRQVHPDLFTQHPSQRSRNAESLKVRDAWCTRVTVDQCDIQL